MRPMLLLFLITLTLSGCMDRTRSRMGDIFTEQAGNAGTSAGGG